MRPMIRCLRIKKNLGVLKPAIIQFDDDDLVIFTGDNGIGKTDILNLIAQYYPGDEDLDVKLDCEDAPDNDMARFLDCSDQYSVEMSPGEHCLENLHDLLILSGKIIIIDTPEAFLSIKGQVEMTDIIQSIKKHNQVFISTNSIPLLRSVESVYLLDEGVWVDPKDYIRESLLSNVIVKDGVFKKFSMVDGILE